MDSHILRLEREDALEDFERRFLVIPGEHPAEGVEHIGVFGVEILGFTRRVQRLLPPVVTRKSVGLCGMASPHLWTALDEACCMVERATRIRL